MRVKNSAWLLAFSVAFFAGCNATSDSGGTNNDNNTDTGNTDTGNTDTGNTDTGNNDGGNQNTPPDNTPNVPTFANAANLRATPLAKSLLVEWDTVATTETVQLYFASQSIDQSNPAAGSNMPAVNTCATSPCLIDTTPGELAYIALLSESNAGDTVDFSQIMAASGQINDSGAVRCYAPDTTIAGGFNVADCSTSAVGTTQDAHVGRDANEPTKLGSGSGGFDFTKLDSTGEPVTDGSEHTCVRDNLTGLVWEVKTTANRDVRYVWGTETGSASGDVNAFVTATNNAGGLCGLTNWRLPTANELFGLVDFDKPHGITSAASDDGVIDQYLSIDRDFFPNTRLVNQYVNTQTRVRHAHYWTSDSYMNQYVEEEYTLVDFFRGSLVNTSNPRANFVLFNVIHDGAFARLVSNGSEGVQP